VSANDRNSRQILAFGGEGQAKIKSVKVGIVGLGGLGSHVVQQLAYLGVRKFVLIDPDLVGEENLNRIVGSTPSDVGKPKVEIAGRMIAAVAGPEATEIIAIHGDLRREDGMAGIAICDVIFGCVDRDGPRLVMNELAVTVSIPYLDLAFGIMPENGRIKEAGGRVIVVRRGGPCLLCCKDIDCEEAAYDLALPSERKLAQERGYLSSSEIRQPSVVSLDGIVASVAVTEFLALITGFREPVQYSCYNLLDGELRRQKNRELKSCFHHLYEKGSVQEVVARYRLQPGTNGSAPHP
jgi:molybdopterin/thiamine biosynthesis adenylyltransferase